MARKIYSRLRIEGTLVAETPLHVGGYAESPDTDLPLAQNGKGELYVPGTSIAGVLRSWCEKNFEKSPVDSLIKELFGPKRTKGREEGHASFVLIEDATVSLPEGLSVEIRDGVGIDRFYGGAADKAKFDRAVLPRGSTLELVMTIEIETQKLPNKNGKPEAEKRGESKEEFKLRENRTKAIFGHLIEALRNGKVRFGAARTRGLGRVKLKGIKKADGELALEPEIKEQNLIGFDNILKLLNGDGASLSIKDLKDATTVSTDSPPRLEITIHWKPRLPVMVKAGYDGIGVDMLPLTSGVDKNKLALVLPGSSIKGALRSHAERIIRTVLNCKDTKATPFHDQIEVLLIADLFGARNKPNNTKGLGALAVDDCYADEAMSQDEWKEVEVATAAEVSFEDQELGKALKKLHDRLKQIEFAISHHVAIDRWTGGAADGALYGVLSPSKVEWGAIQLTLDFGRLKGVELPALMLLLLTLRDVAENRLPFGFATNRGMGEIVVNKIKIEGEGLSGDLEAFEKFKTTGKFSELSQDLKDKLKTEWRQWRKNQKA